MAVHQDLTALSQKAEIFRAPPHAEFAANAQSATRLSADAEVNKLALDVQAGNAQHISRDSMVRWADNTSDSNLTPEEREEKERKKAVSVAVNAMAQYDELFIMAMDAYEADMLSDISRLDDEIDALEKRKAVLDEKIEDVRTNPPPAVIKAEEDLSKTKVVEDNLTVQVELHEQKAEILAEDDKVVGEDGMIYTVIEHENGDVAYQYKDEAGRTKTVADPKLLTQEEFDQQGEELIAQKEDAAADVVVKTETLDKVITAHEAYIAALEKTLQDINDEIALKKEERQIRKDEYKAFKQDRESGMSQEELAAKHPELMARYNELTALEAQDPAAAAARKAEFREARKDHAETITEMEKAAEEINGYITNLKSEEVAKKIESGEMTFEQAAQAYSDPHFYNDFADRHAEYGMKKVEIAETQTQPTWYQNIGIWLGGGGEKTVQTATTEPTSAQPETPATLAPPRIDTVSATPTSTTSTSLASADGQGIKDSKDLSGAFKSSVNPSTQTPAVESTPSIAPTVMAQQMRVTGGMSLGA